MRKLTIILSLVLCSVLLEGVAFYLSSRVPDGAEQSIVETPQPETTFEEMLSAAKKFEGMERFDVAGGYLRAALDEADSKQERALAARAMGNLILKKYREGGDVRPEAAASYLRAAYDDAALHSRMQTEVGLELLEVYDDMGEEELSQEFLEKMISLARNPTDLFTLWKRKFEMLMENDSGWLDMNAALSEAEALPLKSEEWGKLLADVKLRVREKLLEDESWFKVYSETGDYGDDDPEQLRRQIFEDVTGKLEQIVKNGSTPLQNEALLRLADANIAIGDYESAKSLLTEFMARDPSDHLTEALFSLSRVTRVLGEVDSAAELAKSMINRFDFDKHTRGEVLEVVKLLEEHELYAEALELLRGCFSLTENPGKDYGLLIGRAAVLEERLGKRADALEYMEHLLELDAVEAFDATFSEIVSLNMEQSDYEAVEQWVSRFVSRLDSNSEAYSNALFSLFEAKYWLNRPVIEQLFIGAAAIQNVPEDPRTASVELRMAQYIEAMELNGLAVSYYNRIGLLNFFKGDSQLAAFSQNIGEQAMLGKARCLQKLEDWVAADHLYREICKRTKSPLVKSEAAVAWAELARRFGQNREALRRYDLAHEQMLSGAELVRYTLGRSRIENKEWFLDPARMENALELLKTLPENERRENTIALFNEAFNSIHKQRDMRAMERMIDLAYQSDYAEWLPIQSYVLRLYEDKFQSEKLDGLGKALRDKDEAGGASMIELAQVVERLETLADSVKRHKKKALQ